MLPYLTGEVKESPREAFLYASDDGGVMALRVGDYKMTFEEQRATTMRAWAEAVCEAAASIHLQPASRSVRAR